MAAAAPAAVLLGNLAPPIDPAAPRNAFSPDHQLRSCTTTTTAAAKNRHGPLPDAAFIWPPPKRDPSSPSVAAAAAFFASFSAACYSSSSSSSIFGSDGENRNPRGVVAGRRRSNGSGVVNFASGSFSGGGSADGGEDEGGNDDWEEQLRSRLKEIEEMKELERKAEELQSRVAEEGSGEDETEEEKRNRVRRELEKLAKEQAEQRETAKLMFELGQKAYGKGMYSRAIEFLEGALTIIPRLTLFGGEIQIWLAMAYEANNRHRDCIALYEQLEKKHPSISIRRQAAELRYILQAPKLKISKEEMVTIPLIGSSYDRYAGTWSDKSKDWDQRRKVSSINQPPSSKDYWGDFLAWRPPSDWQKSRAFWFAATLWLGLVGVALLLQS